MDSQGATHCDLQGASYLCDPDHISNFFDSSSESEVHEDLKVEIKDEANNECGTYQDVRGIHANSNCAGESVPLKNESSTLFSEDLKVEMKSDYGSYKEDVIDISSDNASSCSPGSREELLLTKCDKKTVQSPRVQHESLTEQTICAIKQAPVDVRLAESAQAPSCVRSPLSLGAQIVCANQRSNLEFEFGSASASSRIQPQLHVLNQHHCHSPSRYALTPPHQPTVQRQPPSQNERFPMVLQHYKPSSYNPCHPVPSHLLSHQLSIPNPQPLLKPVPRVSPLTDSSSQSNPSTPLNFMRLFETLQPTIDLFACSEVSRFLREILAAMDKSGGTGPFHSIIREAFSTLLGKTEERVRSKEITYVTRPPAYELLVPSHFFTCGEDKVKLFPLREMYFSPTFVAILYTKCKDDQGWKNITKVLLKMLYSGNLQWMTACGSRGKQGYGINYTLRSGLFDYAQNLEPALKERDFNDFIGKVISNSKTTATRKLKRTTDKENTVGHGEHAKNLDPTLKASGHINKLCNNRRSAALKRKSDQTLSSENRNLVPPVSGIANFDSLPQHKKQAAEQQHQSAANNTPNQATANQSTSHQKISPPVTSQSSTPHQSTAPCRLYQRSELPTSQSIQSCLLVLGMEPINFAELSPGPSTNFTPATPQTGSHPVLQGNYDKGQLGSGRTSGI